MTTTAPIVLVPGFWLGGWAWDEVAAALRAGGHDVTALTLPGLESAEADRASVTLADHVDAICKAVQVAGPPVVLAVHSGAAVPGYGASDRIPEQIAAMVYVDCGPVAGAINPQLSEPELPLPSWAELEEDGSNLDGLSAEQLATFRQRAVPEPGAAVREAPALSNPARLDVPSTVICSSFPSARVKDAVAKGHPGFGALAELRDVTYLDLPTSHWPMWSRPHELATMISDIARGAPVD
jgi:pimeloyl-ACP methyl ester carboxylesterase